MVNARVLIGTVMLALTLVTFTTAYSFAQQSSDNEELCFKSECWQEEGLTRLATAGCPTPTLFIQSALRELNSYVKGAKKFGLNPQQVKEISKIADHANMIVVKSGGQLEGVTELFVQEMMKPLPDKQKLKELIQEIENSCWDTIAVLARDIYKARTIVSK
ncbi:MAG: hypothetical protein GXO58_05040 [Thermodesulfobacteria bacterium]|nr:hypothetical protein [Thermodesulfobacteriota bacterium]